MSQKIPHKLNHQLSTDDMKIYAPPIAKLPNTTEITEIYLSDTQIECDLRKCKVKNENRKKNQPSNPESFGIDMLDSVEKNETYKYFGYQQNSYTIKPHLGSQYKHRLQSLLKSLREMYSKP